jgi:glycosyltransferase involved in cell wall biosynthesis
MVSDFVIRKFIWKLRMRTISYLKDFRIVASNQDTKERLETYVTKEFWNKIAVAHTAVDPHMINAVYDSPKGKELIREKFDIDKNKFIVLAVGQFIDRKGRWIFMEAAKKLSATVDDINFVWLTPEMPSDRDKKKIEEYALGDSFKLVLSETVGSERSDVLNFFQIADVFVLPSFVEGLPIALLEAMSLGIASISTNVFAIPEAVKNNETGSLIEAGDATALSDSILKLKNDAKLRRSLAENGREFVLENFNENDSAKKVLNVYEQLLAQTK